MATGAGNLMYFTDSEPTLRALLEAASETAAIVTADGTFLAVNSALAALAAVDGIGDLGGHDLFEFIAPQDKAVAEQVREILRNGKAGQFECLTVNRMGRGARKFEFRVVPLDRIAGPDGQPVAVINLRDISERKAAEQTILDTQAQLRSRLEQQRAVAEFGQHAVRAGALGSLLDEAVVIVARTLSVEYCAVMELLPDARTMAIRTAVGWLAGSHPLIEVEGSHCGYTLSSNEPVIIDDYSRETRPGYSRAGN